MKRQKRIGFNDLVTLMEDMFQSWNGRVVKASDLNLQTHHLVFHRVGSNPASSELFESFFGLIVFLKKKVIQNIIIVM